jgi:nucleoside 2-deoxyribosyltransferase
MLTSDSLERIAEMTPPTLRERAERVLLCAIRHQGALGETFTLWDPVYLAIAYVKDDQELEHVVSYLERHQWAERQPMGVEARITPDGYDHYEEIRAKSAATNQAFVAMWFNADLDAVYRDGFDVGIRNAGYRPLRVDQVEHAGRIDDEIIAQIRRSRFLVADFTGHRGGVYFEAGFAFGLGLPVVWSCREDDIRNLHFDIRQFNCLAWNDSAALAHRLQMRIEAVIGKGLLA